MSFKAFDLGGHAAVRKLWTDYMTEVDAVVFVVDSNDAKRHDEARDVRETCRESPTAGQQPASSPRSLLPLRPPLVEPLLPRSHRSLSLPAWRRSCTGW